MNEHINRLKSQLQDTERQVLKLSQNEQKLKQECEQVRSQLNESQHSETTLKTNLADLQRKVNIFKNELYHRMRRFLLTF